MYVPQAVEGFSHVYLGFAFKRNSTFIRIAFRRCRRPERPTEYQQSPLVVFFPRATV